MASQRNQEKLPPPDEFPRGPGEGETPFSSSTGLGLGMAAAVGLFFILFAIATLVLAIYLKGADSEFVPRRPIPGQPFPIGDSSP